MKRRNFLKLAIAAVLVPATVISKTAIQKLNRNSVYGDFGKPISLIHPNGKELTAGEIAPGQLVEVKYNGKEFIVNKTPKKYTWDPGQREEYIDFAVWERAVKQSSSEMLNS